MSANHNAKARHYAALASRIRTLQTNLGESEQLLGDMNKLLGATKRLGAAHAAQFMAVSRSLDVEIAALNGQGPPQASPTEPQST